MTTIPISSIFVPVRLRSSTHDDVDRHIDDLATSITRFGGYPHGLLQLPIVDDSNTLLDGWCRLQACIRLGWTEIPVHIRSRLSNFDYSEIELETNFNRLDFTWQEVVRGVVRIHKTRRAWALNDGNDWTREMTGELIGYSKQYVDNCHNIDAMLSNPIGTEKLKDCKSITEAVRVYLQDRIDEGVREQARRSSLRPVVTPDFLKILEDDIEVVSKPETPTDTQVIDLSQTLMLGDSIRDLLPQWPEASIDHIICDPPYGIDVAMLQQSSHALMDVSRVEEAHTVGENLLLFEAMFPEFYRILKDGGFCICWCDIMNWQYLHDLATNSGFRVQRWPIVWHKTSPCKNQMAYKNTTKNVEFVIVCSKGNATLPRPVTTSVITCANDKDDTSNTFTKPFDAWRMLYESFTTEGQTVLDPFAGEGSSVVSGIRLNRRVLAIEKYQHHHDHLIRNVKAHWTKVFDGKVKFI